MSAEAEAVASLSTLVARRHALRPTSGHKIPVSRRAQRRTQAPCDCGGGGTTATEQQTARRFGTTVTSETVCLQKQAQKAEWIIVWDPLCAHPPLVLFKVCGLFEPMPLLSPHSHIED